MRLGIMVTTDGALDQVAGIARAASERGHDVTVFATDAGVRLLLEPRFTSLSLLPRVAMSFCQQSAEAKGVPLAALPASVARGTQFQNAVMSAESDRVIVL
jgi:hypothetical protein